MNARARRVPSSAPRLGTVKPRLAAEIGPRHALRLYRVMATHARRGARGGARATDVWFAPADRRRRCASGSARMLGASAAQALRRSRRAAAPRRSMRWSAAGIGSAIGRRLSAARRRAAARGRRARGDEIALGPSEDGGYYLIGGRTPLPRALHRCRGAPRAVLAETRARLARAGVPGASCRRLRDVDTAEDARAEGLLT